MLALRWSRARPGAAAPARATAGSAGYDLAAAEAFEVPARGKALVPTGLRVSFEPGHAMVIKSRSGLALKHDIEAGAGVVDSDYRGEGFVLLRNHGDAPYRGAAGDRVAQALFVRCLAADAAEEADADAHGATARGSGGFGSTGSGTAGCGSGA